MVGRTIHCGLLAALIALAPVSVAGAGQDPVQQGARPNGQRGRGQGLPATTPGMPLQQMQTMFDAYALVQAKRVLELTDEQYQQFFARMTALQDVRRRHTQQRSRLLAELRRAWRTPQGDESQLAAQTEALDELERTFEGRVREARRAVDQTLTARQRAGFRFFEEDMDRQKLDFLTRSRQGR